MKRNIKYIIYLICVIILYICILRYYKKVEGFTENQEESIPKVIYQTWKKKDLPEGIIKVREAISAKNPGYSLELYDDDDIENFLMENFDDDVNDAYKKLKVGAAKADLWRYCILYKRGGIYLDIDSDITKPLDDLIQPGDSCIITREGDNHNLFVQWLLIFKKGHPILKEVIDQCVHNINNKTSTDLIELTGPGPYTRAINKILAPHYSKKGANLYSEKDEDLNRELNIDNVEYKSRFYGTDMDGFAKFENTSSDDLYVGNTYWRDEKQLFNK